MDQRRFYKRDLVKARIKIDGPFLGSITGRTQNISDGGLFASMEDMLELPIGSHITMQMLDSANPAVAFNMKVVRGNYEGFGLKFINYELNGERHEISELRQQWNMIKSKVVTRKVLAEV